MRRVLSVGAAVLLFAMAQVLLAAGAQAQDPVTCAKVNPRTGECVITVSAPGLAPTRNQPGPATAVGQRPEPACYYGRGRQEMPCSTASGYWSNERQCRISPVVPPPPRDDPIWVGATDGAIYSCALDTPVGKAITDYTFWSATPPPGAGAPVDPAVLAEEAVAAMGLRAIDIGIAPEAATGSVGLVGLPVWLWVQEPEATTWGPITETASAGGAAVTATATVDRVEWAMGDGTTITCTGAGTGYADAYGSQESPDCGHRYSQASVGRPGDAYSVTATSYWTVDWTGAGASGQIALDFSTEADIQIGELQVLVTD